MRNFPLLKTPRRRQEWDNNETRESNKAPSQPIGWYPERRQRKMTTDNSRTQISQPSSSKVKKRNSSKDQTMLKKSLDELQSFQMEDEVRNVLVMIISLKINSGDAKAIESHLWQAVP
jgi:hypothetical protein